jgi:predicted GIY-YIG superfamily endonuclease
MRGAVVYRVYDVNDALLYIGSAVNFAVRLATHGQRALWRARIARIATKWFPTRQEALAAETAAIKTEFPRWNIRDRSPRHPDGPLNKTYELVARYPGDVCRPMGRIGGNYFEGILIRAGRAAAWAAGVSPCREWDFIDQWRHEHFGVTQMGETASAERGSLRVASAGAAPP